jgi:hypothetical protein
VHADIDGTFDLVLCAYALHHLDDLDRTLRGIRQLAAPGGRVVLIDNVAPRPAVPRSWFWGGAPHPGGGSAAAPPAQGPGVGAVPTQHRPSLAGPPDQRPVPQPRDVHPALQQRVTRRQVHRAVSHPRPVLGRPDPPPAFPGHCCASVTDPPARMPMLLATAAPKGSTPVQPSENSATDSCCGPLPRRRSKAGGLPATRRARERRGDGRAP